MHKAVVLPIIVLAATAVGGLLFLYGGAAFHPATPQAGQGSSNTTNPKGVISVLGHGANAGSFDQRANYRITDATQFAALWQMIYADSGPVLPTIDFSKYEVLAIFDGSHSSGGYDVGVGTITDTNGARTITIVHTQPGDSCVTSGAVTSPFSIVEVTASTLPVTHVDQTETKQCP
jgi:hypothetical protein